MEMKTKLSGAYWISPSDSQFEKAGYRTRGVGNETAYFRNKFFLDRPGKLELSISAHSRYRLWVNGKPVTSGPCKGDRWHQYYESADVSKFLHTGENIIAVKVVAYAPYEGQKNGQFGPTSVYSNAAGPCMIAKGSCVDEHGNLLADITTGNSIWMVAVDSAVEWNLQPISFWMGSMEIVKGDKLPYGWKELSEAEGQWVNAEKRWPSGDYEYGIVPVFPLAERTIPLLFERERSFLREMPVNENDFNSFSFKSENDKWGKISIPPNSKGVVEIDAGELTTGYFKLIVDKGHGSKISIRYAESYFNMKDGGYVKGIRDDSANYRLIGHEDIYYPSGREETYEPFWFRTFRFIRLEVTSGKEELVLYPLEYRETGYPLEALSKVQSKEQWIEPMWDMSLRTLQRCMHETYEDCPYYEQLQYTMDTRLEILFTYMVSGDTRLAAKAIDNYHSSLLPEGLLQSRFPSKEPQVIPAFSLHWIFMLEDYYWQTGDASLPRRYRPSVDAVLDWYDRKVGTLGLVEDLGFWEFFDWVDEWDNLHGSPRAILSGPSTLHNLVYAYGLQTAARLSRATGRASVAEEYEERAAAILKAVDKYCWDERKQLYREGPDFHEYSQHAQLWAVLTGLADGEHARSIMSRTLNDNKMSRCSIPMTFYFIRALEKAGLYSETKNIWDELKGLLDQHLTTCPEIAVNPRSDCHAWSALALYEFTRSFLGVKPLVPGWEKIRIEPKAEWLSHIKGQVITPKGLVKVELTKNNGKYEMEVTGPEEVSMEICLPDNTVHVCEKSGKFIYHK